MPTVRIPAFPHPVAPINNGSGGGAEGGAGRIQVADGGGGEVIEEERAFEWMSGMLLQGSGALRTAGIVPAAGSSVVLDLGAISQVFVQFNPICEIFFSSDLFFFILLSVRRAD